MYIYTYIYTYTLPIFMYTYYLYLYLYMPHKGSKQQELPFCYKGGHTCLHCLEEFFIAYCLLLSSFFIAYLLYQTECDGRLGNQMSVYATAWVKHKVYLWLATKNPNNIWPTSCSISAKTMECNQFSTRNKLRELQSRSFTRRQSTPSMYWREAIIKNPFNRG